LPFRLREKMGTRKNKNVKVIFLLGSALNRAGRRGFAFDSQAKIFPLKLPQFLPARQRDVEEEKTCQTEVNLSPSDGKLKCHLLVN